MARPFTAEDRTCAQRLAGEWGSEALEESPPISVIGTVATRNAAG
jgi:hypothetical protein